KRAARRVGDRATLDRVMVACGDDSLVPVCRPSTAVEGAPWHDREVAHVGSRAILERAVIPAHPYCACNEAKAVDDDKVHSIEVHGPRPAFGFDKMPLRPVAGRGPEVQGVLFKLPLPRRAQGRQFAKEVDPSIPLKPSNVTEVWDLNGRRAL